MGKKKYTKEQINIILDPYLSDKEIAWQIGSTPKAVSMYRNRLLDRSLSPRETRKRKMRKYTETQEMIIRDSTITAREAAKRIGFTCSAVQYLRRKWGIKRIRKER